jgi:antitoxin VapB
MMKEVRAKTFKSGNSVALRLPKALGIKEGVEMTVREEHGKYVVEPVEAPKRKLDVDAFWGKAKFLHAPERRRDFDERPSTIAARRIKNSE